MALERKVDIDIKNNQLIIKSVDSEDNNKNKLDDFNYQIEMALSLVSVKVILKLKQLMVN